MSAAAGWLTACAFNALWQVPLLAVCAWCIDRLLGWASPGVRHRVWVAALLLECAVPLCPSAPLRAALLNGSTVLAAWLRHPAPGDGRVSVIVTFGSFLAGRDSSPWVAVVLPLVVILVVLFLALRLGWHLWRLRQLRLRAWPMKEGAQLRDSWQRCSTHFCMGQVELLESAEIRGPVAFGWPTARLVLPQGLAPTLEEAELLAVLAHEAAHIERRDYLKNLLYEIAALPVAWHPALWFTRARLAETREMVCDARAAELFDRPERFGRSLMRLALLLLQHGPAKVPNAIGIFDAHTLQRRIEMLRTREKAHWSRRAIAVVACILLAGTGCITAVALRAEMGSSATAKGTPRQVPSGVMAGQVVTKAAPVYPQKAKEDKVQGAVVLQAVIGGDGRISALSVVSGPEPLQQSALDAVKQWVYKPYLLNGQPTEVETTITINYSLAP